MHLHNLTTTCARSGVYVAAVLRARIRTKLRSACTNYVDTRQHQHVRAATESDYFDMFEINLNHPSYWLRLMTLSTHHI